MKKRNAFTMIEAIIAIVLFGIIATIGANIIAKMYMNYIQSRVVNYLQTQSEITLEQIAKRLQYRIKNTMVVAKSSDGNFINLSDSDVNSDYDVIQWIGYSNEAMLLGDENKAGWSGFIDVDASNGATKTLSTPGSTLSGAAAIMNILSNGEVDLTASKPAALIFKHPPVTTANGPAKDYGLQGNDINISYVAPIKRNGDTELIIEHADTPVTIYEQYYLAHTAYAITADTTNGSNTDFKLNLHYNYQPWSGDSYSNASSSAILAENVNLFRIKQTGTSIRLKLCLHDGNRSGFNRQIVACKEEVVL